MTAGPATSPTQSASPTPDRAPTGARSRVVLPGGRPLGIHLPLGKGMVKAVERADAIGAGMLQVFIDNPTAWKVRNELPKDLPAFRRRLEELEMGPLSVHCCYLVNLAGHDQELRARSITRLAHELRTAPAYGGAFVVVHIGSHRGAGVDTGVEHVGEAVALVLAQVPPTPDGALLVLETSAGGGDGIGSTVEELAAILQAAERRGADPSRIGLCLDTAHLWGAGHDLRTAEGVDALIADLDARIGASRVAMIHLNDSKAGLGSHLDRHEHLGAGMIGPEGLGRMLVHPALSGAAFYLETPGVEEGFDAVNVARAGLLIEGRPLEPLPDASELTPWLPKPAKKSGAPKKAEGPKPKSAKAKS